MQRAVGWSRKHFFNHVFIYTVYTEYKDFVLLPYGIFALAPGAVEITDVTLKLLVRERGLQLNMSLLKVRLYTATVTHH